MGWEIEGLIVWRKLPSEPTEEKKNHKIGYSLVAAVRELEEFGWVWLSFCTFLILLGILQRGVLGRTPAAAPVSGHQPQTARQSKMASFSLPRRALLLNQKEEGLALPVLLKLLIQNNVVPVINKTLLLVPPTLGCPHLCLSRALQHCHCRFSFSYFRLL